MTDESVPSLELVLHLLAQSPGSSARTLTRRLREAGLEIRKRQVNSLLYTALGAKRVRREDGDPPRWFVVATPVISPSTAVVPPIPPEPTRGGWRLLEQSVEDDSSGEA